MYFIFADARASRRSMKSCRSDASAARAIWLAAAVAALVATSVHGEESARLLNLPESHSSFFPGKFSLEITRRETGQELEPPVFDASYAGASVKVSSVFRHVKISDDDLFTKLLSR